MNDEMPDTNFKEKKEKKGGALGWLKNRLGLGSRSALGGPGANPAAMNLGRAFGAGSRLGSSSAGLAGLLTGKVGILATLAAVIVGGGVYLANQSSVPEVGTGAFSSSKAADNYVPSILRKQQDQGSSLDMFKETNKGAGLAMDAAQAKAAADAKAGAEAAGEKDATGGEGQAQGADQAGPGSNMQDMLSKLQGGAAGGGGGGSSSSKFSNMGGFGNKFNDSQFGGKTGFTTGIGAGFQGMPKFAQRQNQLLAMKGSKQPVMSNSKGGRFKGMGKGSFNQAHALRAAQKSYSGTSVDAMRSTQDTAWTGTTADGTPTSGSGLSSGAGIASSPSLDNAGSGGGTGDSGGVGSDPGCDGGDSTPDPNNPKDESPWKSLVAAIMALVIIACILIVIGAIFVTMKVPPWISALGMWMCGIGIGLGVIALGLSIMLMAQYGQTMLGGVYAVGAALVIVAGALGMTGNPGEAVAPVIFWLAGAAALIALIGAMLGN